MLRTLYLCSVGLAVKHHLHKIKISFRNNFKPQSGHVACLTMLPTDTELNNMTKSYAHFMYVMYTACTKSADIELYTM